MVNSGIANMDTLPVLKIELAGRVTSFRYPYFSQGYQPTLLMPPPSTIYGHICSAVGDWIDPVSTQFGYTFKHQGMFVDYREHLHFDDPIQPFPFNRELLFEPRLTLYLTNLDLMDAFRRPRYAVVLGRSQDLMTYTSIEVIQLERADAAYFAGTILPLSFATALDADIITMTMARYIDQRRHPTWETYALLAGKAVWPIGSTDQDLDSEYDEFDAEPFVIESNVTSVWIDPSSPSHGRYPSLKRAVWLHSFVDAQ